MRTESSVFGASTRNRVLVIIAVVALSLWTLFLIQETIKLGLDSAVHRCPIQVCVCDGGHRGDTARRAGDAGLAVAGRLRLVAEHRGGAPDHHRHSVNDTIVIFDRVRENAKQSPRETRRKRVPAYVEAGL